MVVPGIGNTYYERALMLDAGPLIALYTLDDLRGKLVKQFLTQYAVEKYPVCVTYLIIAEVQKRLLYDVGRGQASQFLHDSLDGSINIVSIDNTDHALTKEILERFNDQNISFADAASMAIMKRLGIFKVMSYDFHFSLMGFEVISPS